MEVEYSNKILTTNIQLIVAMKKIENGNSDWLDPILDKTYLIICYIISIYTDVDIWCIIEKLEVNVESLKEILILDEGQSMWMFSLGMRMCMRMYDNWMHRSKPILELLSFWSTRDSRLHILFQVLSCIS